MLYANKTKGQAVQLVRWILKFKRQHSILMLYLVKDYHWFGTLN